MNFADFARIRHPRPVLAPKSHGNCARPGMMPPATRQRGSNRRIHRRRHQASLELPPLEIQLIEAYRLLNSLLYIMKYHGSRNDGAPDEGTPRPRIARRPRRAMLPRARRAAQRPHLVKALRLVPHDGSNPDHASGRVAERYYGELGRQTRAGLVRRGHG